MNKKTGMPPHTEFHPFKSTMELIFPGSFQVFSLRNIHNQFDPQSLERNINST